MDNEQSQNVAQPSKDAEAGRGMFRAGSSLPEDTLIQLRSKICIVKQNGETYGISPDVLLKAFPSLPLEVVASEHGTIDLDSKVQVLSVVTKDVVPELIKTIDTYNIVRYDGMFYVLPHSLGEVRWGEDDVAALTGVLTTRQLSDAFALAKGKKKEKGLVERIREITTGRNPAAEVNSRPPSAAAPDPRLVGSVEAYNIVHYDGWYYGIPQGLGKMDLRTTNPMGLPGVIRELSSAKAEERIRELLRPGSSNPQRVDGHKAQPHLLGSLNGYNIVEYEGWFYGIPQTLGNIDLSRTDVIEMPGVIRDVTRMVVENEIRELSGTKKAR